MAKLGGACSIMRTVSPCRARAARLLAIQFEHPPAASPTPAACLLVLLLRVANAVIVIHFRHVFPVNLQRGYDISQPPPMPIG